MKIKALGGNYLDVLNTTAAAKPQQENTGTVEEEPKYKKGNVYNSITVWCDHTTFVPP
jgi:hypothetical protein